MPQRSVPLLRLHCAPPRRNPCRAPRREGDEVIRTDIATMDLRHLLAYVSTDIEHDANLNAVLARCSQLSEAMPALALILRILIDEPTEIAAERSGDLAILAERLHADSDGPTICRIASRALAQFAIEDQDDPAQHHMGGDSDPRGAPSLGMQATPEAWEHAAAIGVVSDPKPE